MDESEIITGLVTIVVFGVGAQWIGRRTGIPSLLLLLPAGLLAGDVLGLVEPIEMFGDLLFPLVTMLLALLLFQSGLQLRLSELPAGNRSSVTRLVTVGLVITFTGASLAAVVVLDVPNELALLVGAILVVSGPTVVGPLLDVVRPQEPAGSILLWEGTTLDPIGATIGVVVLNLIVASDRSDVHPLWQLVERMGLGMAIGVAAAGLLVLVMSRFLLTHSMEAAVALLLATLAFGVAEVILSEAGLFATVTMGVVAANQRKVAVRRIEGFGETLEVLIIGTLFILLGALVEIDALLEWAWPALLITLALVLIVRPMTAAISLVRTPLSGRARAMVGWMDPRGVVAAATTAQFAETLEFNGYDADFMLPLVFGVIVCCGVIYGLTAKPVANALGVSRPPARGVGLVGDDPWLVPFANALDSAGVEVLFLSTDNEEPHGPTGEALTDSVTQLSVRRGTAEVQRMVPSADVAKVVVSAGSDVVNTLVTDKIIELLGRRHVLRVPDSERAEIIAGVPERWSAEPFAGRVSRNQIIERLEDGARIQLLDETRPQDAVALAEVGADGTVSFRPNVDPPSGYSQLIGIVGP